METGKFESFKSTISESIEILESIAAHEELEVISSEELKAIKDLNNELGYYNSSFPRVFLMGEFNAGKSTLVNALIGKKYAPTDIFEMTAWVSKFWQSANDYCKINFNDNTSESRNITEFLQDFESKKYDREFLKRIKTVEFGLQDYDKNYIIIDTPGFGGINSDNEKKLIELIYEADVVLFVVDAESVGSIKEAALISECIKKGIPYFIVVTKIDLVKDPNEVDEIRKYIHQKYSADETKILTVSADENDGLDLLDERLKELAANFNSSDRRKAEIGFLRIIAERLLNVLKDMKNLLLVIEDKVNSFNAYIDSVSKTIRKSIQINIEEFVKKSLLQNKRETIITELTTVLSNSKGNVKEDQIMNIFKANLGDDFLDFTEKKIDEEILIQMKAKWDSHLDEIKDKSKDVFSGMKGNLIENDGSIHTVSVDGNYDIQINKMTGETLKRGMKGTLGFAGVLTAYAAWFGPAAVAVTLPMALTGIGLPIVAIGGAISTALAINKREKVKDQMKNFAIEITDNVVDKIVNNIVSPKLPKKIDWINEKVSKAIKNQFYNENSMGFDNINLSKLNKIKSNLENIVV